MSITVHDQLIMMSDRLRAQLFGAVIETVLLYNSETWTMTALLKRQLNGAHSALHWAAFQIVGCVRTEEVNQFPSSTTFGP